MRCIDNEEAKALVESMEPDDFDDDENCVDDDPHRLALHERLVERGLLILETVFGYDQDPDPDYVIRWSCEVYRITALGKTALLCYRTVNPGVL